MLECPDFDSQLDFSGQPDFETIRKRLRSRRAWLGLRQDDVADKMGTSPQYISRLETGDGPISLTVLYKFAMAYECSVCDFLTATDNNSDNYLMNEINSRVAKCNSQERRRILKLIDLVMADSVTLN